MRYIHITLFYSIIFLGQYRDIPDVVTKVATAAGGFLKLETSARAIGMGGSFVASGRGVSGIPYNPSESIAYIEKNEAYFSQVQYLAGITTWCFNLWYAFRCLQILLVYIYFI